MRAVKIIKFYINIFNQKVDGVSFLLIYRDFIIFREDFFVGFGEINIEKI